MVDGQAEGLGIAVASHYVYIAACETGLHIIDVSNLKNPRKVGVYDTPGCATDGVVEGEYAYIADGRAGLRVLFVANPSSPVEVGFYKTSQATEVKKVGDLLYVADEDGGMLILRFLGLSHRVYLPLLLRSAQ